MNESGNGHRGGRPSLSDLLKLAPAVVTIGAVARELRKPKEERTWHGVLGFVPYDFRKPTFDRVKQTFWNPDGAIIVSRVFGVGWTVNVGGVVSRLRARLAER